MPATTQIDSIITQWILEYLIRQLISDLLAKKLIGNLQVCMADDYPRLKRAILLRAIDTEVCNGSISETTLESLEFVEELDRKGGIIVTDTMKAAYCAAAVECTVKYLWASTQNGRRGHYLDAVQRIWRERVEKMEELKASELLTEDLRKWRDDIEAAVWDTNVSNRLLKMNTRNDAVRLVGIYLGEAMALVGPPFLEVVARTEEETKRKEMEDKGGKKTAAECNLGPESTVGDEVVNGEKAASECNVGQESTVGDEVLNGGKGGENAASECNVGLESTLDDGVVNGGTRVCDDAGEGTSRRLANASDVADRAERKGKEVAKKKPLRRKYVASCKHTAKRVKIADSAEPDKDASSLSTTGVNKVQEAPKSSDVESEVPLQDAVDIPSSKYDTLPTPEVSKVQEALKSSSMALQAVVKDPLPDALHLAATILNRQRTSVEIQNDAPNPSVNVVTSETARKNGKDGDVPNSTTNQTAEAPQTEDGNAGVPSCGHQNDVPKPSLMERNASVPSCSRQSDVPKPSLMERNNTAHTFEWDDSVDGSDERAANRYHLDSPNRKAISPLRAHEVTKFARRRKIKRWSLEEEDALREGVQKFGRGSWKLILNSKRDIFVERTEVDLKDKWRNMTRY